MRALPRRRRRTFSRAELADARGVREGVGREGARVPRLRRGRRGRARRSRSSSRRSELDALPRAARARPCSSARTSRADGRARARRAAPPPRPRARADRRDALDVPLGHSTSRCSSGTRTTGRWTPCTTRSRARPETARTLLDERSRARRSRIAYDLVGNGSELGGGSFRIHEPRAAGAGLRPARHSARRSSARSSASCSTRCAMGAPPHGGIALGIDRLRWCSRASRTSAT